MPKDKRYHPPRRTTIDPYTGEKKPVPEDAENMHEEIPVEPEQHTGRNYLLEEESAMDFAAADDNAEVPAGQIGHFTEDEDIKADFTERQGWATAGR